jgi:serine protease inhibitor
MSVNILKLFTGLFPHYYDAELDCDILGIPYKQNATTMYVIMPKNSSPSKIRELQKQTTAEKFNDLINQMRIKTAVILFPKMHLKSSHHLKTNLRDLGLKTLFNNALCDLSVLSSEERLIFSRRARDMRYKVESEFNRNSSLTMKDLVLRKRIQKKSGMNKKIKRNRRQTSTPSITEQLEKVRMRNDLMNPGLFAEEVVHKVDLIINEKGTEGGAATAITLNRSGTNVVFRVDVPFMFFIRHDPTQIPLFLGTVFEPQN